MLQVPQENLTIMVVVALWPLYPVIAICCPPLWRGMRDAFFVELVKTLSRKQYVLFYVFQVMGVTYGVSLPMFWAETRI